MGIKAVYLPKPLPHQIPVLTDPARFKVLACGRRWSKTSCGLLATIRGHGPERGFHKGAIDGGNIWWIAPTFNVGNKIWRDVNKACAYAWSRKSEQEKRIEFPGGGSLTVKSADNPDSLRGDGLDGVVIDEAAFIDKKVWHESLRPALSDKQGWGMFFSTPNGQNWFYELFKNATRDTTGTWRAWQRPSSDNPLMTLAELETAKLDIGLRSYAQEFEAQFTDQEGAEFSGSYFSESIWFNEWPDNIRMKVVALDPSKGKSEKSDFSAFAMLALDMNGTLWVDMEMDRMDSTRIIKTAMELQRKFEPVGFGVEINQFQEVLADQMAMLTKQAGMMMPIYGIHNHENKIVRIRATLTPFLARGDIKFRRTRCGKMLVDQLRAFPLDKHDDGPDALEMAIRLTRELLNNKPANPDDSDFEFSERVRA